MSNRICEHCGAEEDFIEFEYDESGEPVCSDCMDNLHEDMYGVPCDDCGTVPCTCDEQYERSRDIKRGIY